MRSVPALLREAASFVKAQKHGALGWFDSFGPEEIPPEWDPKNADRLRKAGVAFLTLPEGSLLALVDDAVVLLGSEGDRRTIATSLEEFLLMWSKGETDVGELDDEESAVGRKALAKWLTSKKIKAPKAKAFDFQAWLDGAPPAAAAPTTAPSERRPTATMKRLGPKVQKLASVMGLRADDPKAIEYVTKTLGKKLPQATSEHDDSNNVAAPKAGIEMVVAHDVLHDAYAPIHKTAKSFVPYLSLAWVSEKIGEPVLGVPWKASTREEIAKVLGEPSQMRPALMSETKKTVPVWRYVLDEGAHTVLEIELRGSLRVTIAIDGAHELERHDRITAALLLAWAAAKNLIDGKRLAVHADLLDAVKKRKATGTQLYDALGRGLWDDHLVPDDDLRSTAYRYFHNLGGRWITADLKKIFGKRPGPYGHDEPKLDDATWDAVDKASRVFAERFARWV